MVFSTRYVLALEFISKMLIKVQVHRCQLRQGQGRSSQRLQERNLGEGLIRRRRQTLRACRQRLQGRCLIERHRFRHCYRHRLSCILNNKRQRCRGAAGLVSKRRRHDNSDDHCVCRRSSTGLKKVERHWLGERCIFNHTSRTDKTKQFIFTVPLSCRSPTSLSR